MKNALFTLLAAFLALPALAQDVDREKVQAALDAFWGARKAEVLAAPEIAPRDAPAIDSAGVALCPAHRVGTLEFLLEKETRQDGPDAAIILLRQHVAAYCPVGPEAWVRTEAGKGEPTWRGPFADPSFPKPEPGEIPVGPGDEGGASREAVQKCLRRHITDSGDQGFFENRFQDVKDLGPGAVPHLFGIFESSDDQQMKHLAVEALGEVADASARDRLMSLAEDPANERYILSIAVALHRIGETSVIDRMVENHLRQLEGTDLPSQKSAIHAQLGLIHSLVKKEDEALGHYQTAVELDPTNAIAHYNLACSYSKLDRVDDALGALEGAMKAGYDDWEWMMVDGDLEQVRGDARFKDLFEKYRK